MNLIKNIFKSIAILFGIAVLVVLFGFAIMMIFNVQIFGYQWLNVEIGDKIQNTGITNADKIYIETNGVAVEVRHSTDVTEIEYNFAGKLQGVFKTDSIAKEERPIYFTANTTDGVYEIKTQEPSGLSFYNNSKLTIWIPSNMALTDLSIKTGTNNISFDGNTESLALDNFSLEATTDLKEYTISNKVTVKDSFSLKTSTGRIYVNADIQGSVLVDSLGSTVIFKNHVGNGSSAVRIAGGNPHIQFGDISDASSNVNVRGDIAVDCTSGGLIDISGAVLGTVTLVSPNVTFNVETTCREVTANDGFNILNITNLNGDATINKIDGTLYIKNCNAQNLVVTGNQHNVTIDNLYGNATISNNYGDINVTFADNASSSCVLTANTKNSAINVKNIPCKVVLSSENGVINTEFVNIVGDNILTTQNSVFAKVKDNLSYKLTTKSKTGNVYVSLGRVEYFNWDDAETVEEYKVKTDNVLNGSDTNKLTIQTDGGEIKVEILSI